MFPDGRQSQLQSQSGSNNVSWGFVLFLDDPWGRSGAIAAGLENCGIPWLRGAELAQNMSRQVDDGCRRVWRSCVEVVFVWVLMRKGCLLR